MPQPEQQARENIDRLLRLADWTVCEPEQANIHAGCGIAIREFPLKSGYGYADYLLYINGKAAGVIEAKKEGVTLTGVEIQSAKYIQGLPDGLLLACQPTDVETHFSFAHENTYRTS